MPQSEVQTETTPATAQNPGKAQELSDQRPLSVGPREHAKEDWLKVSTKCNELTQFLFYPILADDFFPMQAEDKRLISE